MPDRTLCKYEIKLKLPSLNEYIASINKNRYKGNSLKKDTQNDILWFLTPKVKITVPVDIIFIWHEKDKRRDKDNVCFAKKFILDALQIAGILPNDNNRCINSLKDIFVYDKKYEVTVICMEVQNEVK